MASSNISNDNTIILPDDIIFTNILPKLPPESLSRFQYVNKLWNSIISDPNFKISPEHVCPALFISPQKIFNKLWSNNFSNPLRLEHLPQEPHAHAPMPQISIIFGSCNGLVLFSDDINIFLWNPCTSYCQKVLELDFLGDDYNEVYNVVPGFCYDTSLDDYVVLALFTQFFPVWKLSVISATLKTKMWRRVAFPYDIDSVLPTWCKVDNILHWLASFYGRDIIIYFDAPSNAFNELPTPDKINEGWNGDRDNLVGLGVLGDNLCLMRRLNICDVEVLVMKDYGVKESWTTMFCIPDVTNYEYYGLTSVDLIFCSLKMDDVLLVQYNLGVCAYYPSSHTKEEIEVSGGLIPYEESLVSPTEYYWDDEYDNKMTSTTAFQAVNEAYLW